MEVSFPFVLRFRLLCSLLPSLLLGPGLSRATEPEAPTVNGATVPGVELALTVDPAPLDGLGGPRVTSYADVLEPVQAGVVAVYSARTVRQSMTTNPLLRQFFGDEATRESRVEGLGSGVIVTPDGYILTNNHVVQGAEALNVRLQDGRELPATLVGADAKTDVAVIKIEGSNLPAATLADSDRLRVGDLVFAVGNPLDIGQTVTMGIVSAKGRNNLGLLDAEGGYEDFIQTDASINMGNSGGALVDAGGRLIGINTAILSTTRGNIGIGFAIPVNLAASVMRSLVRSGTVERGFLGVGVQPVTAELAEMFGLPAEERRAVVVTQVVPDSPADRAGLRYDDIILRINGRGVGSLADLRLVVSQLPPGSTVPVDLYRPEGAVTVAVELGRLPGTDPSELLEGVEAEPLSDEERRELIGRDDLPGLRITRVDTESPYARRLAEGMVILEINRQPVESLAVARELLRPGRNLLFVHHRGAFTYIPLLVRER